MTPPSNRTPPAELKEPLTAEDTQQAGKPASRLCKLVS
jgi:hypothetical protein